MLDNVAHCLYIVRFNFKEIVFHFTQSEDTENLGRVVTTQSSNSKKLGKVVIPKSENMEKLSVVMITQEESTEMLGGMMLTQSELTKNLARVVISQSVNTEKLGSVMNAQSKHLKTLGGSMTTPSEEMKNFGKMMILQSEDSKRLDRVMSMHSSKTKKLVMLTQAEDLKEFFGLMITQSGDAKKLNDVMPVARLSFENMCFRFTLMGSIVPCTIVLSNYSKSNNIHINLAVKHDLDYKVIILSVTCVRRDVRVDEEDGMKNRGSLIVNSAEVAFTTSARSKTDDFLLFYKGFFGVQKYFTRSHIFLKDVFLPVVGCLSRAHFVAMLADCKYQVVDPRNNPVTMQKDLTEHAMLISRHDLVSTLRDLNKLAVFAGHNDPVTTLRDRNNLFILTDRIDLVTTLKDLLMILLGHLDFCTKSGQNDKMSHNGNDQVSPISDSSDSGISGCGDFVFLPAAHSNHITSMFTHLHLLQIKHLRWSGARMALYNPWISLPGTIELGFHPKVSDTSTFHHTFVR